MEPGWFHPIIARWFSNKFSSPTDVQVESWRAIRSGTHALIAAPTGSGKTLAAFLSCLDTLFKQCLAGELTDQTRILYVSPLKALSNDVQCNLRQPLSEISHEALAAGFLTPEIRVEVRTGDSSQKNRRLLLERPPHILITTPESLFLLLTAAKSREILRTVKTVIIDEIHAVAGNKRGAHLALSLERLEALTTASPIRIGLSATQRPIQEIAQFLIGHRINQPLETPSSLQLCRIVDMGSRRQLDVRVEVPKDELGAVASNAIWTDIYDRLTDLISTHRSTLVFVNTRRLAERVAHHLTERLGEELVATHHGSLSRRIRLSAESRLKAGQTRAVVATASLELGIDIGTVDLVCQIGSPRSIATALQRIGRAGHWVGAIPKGRLFCTTRDELVECAALVRTIREGRLDRIAIPVAPLDILAQQIVAAAATQEWKKEDLFQLCTRAHPYRDVTVRQFEDLVTMLAEGYVPGRGRHQAFIFYDRPHGIVRSRRGARLAALTSGGAIPDTATYAVVAEPQDITVGTVDEDFAIESLAGDIMLLGNTSWRIKRVETGTVRVEDAHGAPPTIPFWRGEAPSRTIELSEEVASLRQELAARLSLDASDNQDNALSARAYDPQLLSWIEDSCGLDCRGAEQVTAYLASGIRALGVVPTQKTVIAERFFDEAGGMQLVIHAPFGGRINRAWALALRKRFCVTFDFELQAAATDEGLVISLGPKHSFPLDIIFSMLTPDTVRGVLTQAILASPMFIARWRWNASRALALLRFRNGKRVPLHLQRMKAEDLLTGIFPMATACQDNHIGDIPIPDHPLIQQTIRDCLEEAMDVVGLESLLREIAAGNARCLTVESPAPSPFSHEILNANPYAFLDDAPLEERRARAVNMRQLLPTDMGKTLGALDSTAIASVEQEAWPIVRDSNELQEALYALVWVPEDAAPHWRPFLPALLASRRAHMVTGTSVSGQPATIRGWIAPEHAHVLVAIFPDQALSVDPPLENSQDKVSAQPDAQEAMLSIARGWMEVTGPRTIQELATMLHLPTESVLAALVQLESQGHVLRGHFRSDGHDREQEREQPDLNRFEWCSRHLLARIHQRTVTTLRQAVEPASALDFIRFLLRWQHVVPSARLHGEAGLLEILEQLAGFEAPAAAWEPHLLRSRLASYNPDLLDTLCLRGRISWGRLSLPPFAEARGNNRRKFRVVPSGAAPITFFPRDDADWLVDLAQKGQAVSAALLPEHISPTAHHIFRHLCDHGASFFTDIVRATRHLPAEIEQGLWELVSVGLVTADVFDNLRALLDPHRRRGEGRQRARRPRHAIGRWALLRRVAASQGVNPTHDEHVTEKLAGQLLRRYGIVFRDLLKRESMAVAWRDLLIQYRRMEWRGEIRGGRFVSGFTGEQFGLPEAVEALRAVRKDPQIGTQEIRLSAADPLNLAGILLPGQKIPALSGNTITFRNGMPVSYDPTVSVSA